MMDVVSDEQRPGPYFGPGGHGFGQTPGPGMPPAGRPAQVTAASWIGFVLGGLTALLLLMLPTDAGPEIAETLTGEPDTRALVALAAVIGAVVYLLPAYYLRKRRPWARTMMIVVAALGIASGLLTLPGGVLGLALHTALLVMMVQQPTKAWFAEPRQQ